MERNDEDPLIPPGHTLEIGQVTGVSRHYVNGRWKANDERSCLSELGTVYAIDKDGNAFIRCNDCEFGELAYMRY